MRRRHSLSRLPAVVAERAGVAPLLRLYALSALAVALAGLLAALSTLPYFVDPATGEHVSLVARVLFALEGPASALSDAAARAAATGSSGAAGTLLAWSASAASTLVQAGAALKRYGPAVGTAGGRAGVWLAAVESGEAWIAAQLERLLHLPLELYRALRAALVALLLQLVQPPAGELAEIVTLAGMTGTAVLLWAWLAWYDGGAPPLPASDQRPPNA